MVAITALLLSGAALVHGQAAAATDFTDLVGTWNSKANSTMTGPGFYDPVNEKFTEPEHTGISYSFSANGWFEEAYYRAVANPTNPKCPKGIIQWQHGQFEKLANGSLTLKPIKVDGRQLLSDPCTYKNAIYTRYNQTELFKGYQVVVDDYHKIRRLNLFKHDGSPMMPLYIAMVTPQMLETKTLNPLVTSTAAGGAKATAKVKRSNISPDHNVMRKKHVLLQADRWWWFGVFMTGSGAFLYYFF